MMFFVSDTGDSKFKLSQQHMAFCGLPRLSKMSFVGFHMARDEGRPLATSSLAVGSFAANWPLHGQKSLTPLAKRSTCSKSTGYQISCFQY